MHFVLLPIGSAGDVHPFIGLGLRLRARGHTATLFTSPHFETLIRRHGFRFEPLGTEEQFHEVIENPKLWEPMGGFRLVADWAMIHSLPIILERLRALRAEQEIVVLAQATALGARLAQLKDDIPLLTVHLQPAMFRSSYDSARLPNLLLGDGVPRWLKRFQFWLTDRLVIDPIVTAPLNTALREQRLPPAKDLLSRWWHSPQGVVALFPPWYMQPQPDWPAGVKLTGFPLWDDSHDEPLPADVEAFLAAGDPPIAFTPGSAMKHAGTFFEAAVAACGRLGRRGLLLTRHAEQIPANLPASVRHVSYAPFTQLLPRCAALVHHGGIGSAAQALAAGVPHLVYPMAHDQPDNAYRLQKLGVAESLPPKKFRTDRVAAALDRLTSDPQVAHHCRDYAERIAAQDGLEETVDWIESRSGIPA